MSISAPLLHKTCSTLLENLDKEDWKYTNLRRHALDSFLPTDASQYDSVSPESLLEFIQPLLIDPKSTQQTIYYNGQLICMGANAADNIRLPKNTVHPNPYYIVHVTNPETTPLLINPKNVILAEENSQGTIIEIYISLGEKSAFTNTITEINIEKGAQLNHVFLQRSLSKSLQLAHVTVKQQANSHYTGTSVSLGGETNRVAFAIQLQESNAHCQFYALAAAHHQQQMDVHLTVQHLQPHTMSSIISRGVVKDKARSAFTGKIVVAKDARLTSALLENKNLLLSEEAEADTRPQLEIYNNDVQCSHGATVGHLDLEALFYLKSRGIPEKEAIQLLIDAFSLPSLQGLPAFMRNNIAELIHEYS